VAKKKDMIEENVILVNKEGKWINAKKWRHMKSTLHRASVFRLNSKTKSCCSSERIINTIPRYFGQTLVAVISEKKPTFKPEVEGCLRKFQTIKELSFYIQSTI
jgi:hypothetical protein